MGCDAALPISARSHTHADAAPLCASTGHALSYHAVLRPRPTPAPPCLAQMHVNWNAVAADSSSNAAVTCRLQEELMTAMGLNTEEEGSAMQVLRRGLKNSTWWEDDYEQEGSHEWRL